VTDVVKWEGVGDEERYTDPALATKFAEHFPAASDSTTRFYHGTTAAGVRSICTAGVQAEYFRKHTNFGSAFYVTPDFGYAACMAHAAAVCGDSEAVVMVFDVPAHILATVPVVHLENAQWEEAIVHYRRGVAWSTADLELYHKTAPAYRGAIASNATCVDTGATPLPLGASQWAFRIPPEYLRTTQWTVFSPAKVPAGMEACLAMMQARARLVPGLVPGLVPLLRLRLRLGARTI